MTSREAALVALGEEDVAAYERVKSFYTKNGTALQQMYAKAVGGRVGGRGEANIVSRLGDFEFCSSENTTNAAGTAAQIAKVGAGRIVQATGRLRKGRISGVTFLELHGVRDPDRVAGECEVAALNLAKREVLQQERLL